MDFQFASPWYLSLLFILLWMAVRPSSSQPISGTLLYGHIQLIQSPKRSWRMIGRQQLPWLRRLTLVLLILALARPQKTQTVFAINEEKIDMVLALDISNSMAALDFDPHNRLEAAKLMIEQLLAERPHDRIGLVVFSHEAFIQSPPTRDHAALSRLVEQLQLSSDLGIEDGTALGQGLAQAAFLLQGSAAENQVVILLTDGVDTIGSVDPLTMAVAADALHIRVYTIGMGRPGPVPFPQEGRQGQYMVEWESPLDETTLQQIATLTHGHYYRAEDYHKLQQIYAEVQQLENTNQTTSLPPLKHELFPWFAWPALALFLVEICLRQTILRQLP